MTQPTQFDVLLARMQACWQAGEIDAAVAAGDLLTRLAPREPAVWLQLGLLHLHRGALPQAESAFRMLTELDAANPGAWHNLSVVLREQGRFAEAEATARRALQLEAGSAAIWLNLANAIYCQTRWDEAAAAYRQALALDPRDAAAWSNLGATEQLRGELPAALAAFERSLALAPGDPLVLNNYAQLLNQLNQPSRSAEILESLLAQQPQLASAWVALAQARLALRDWPAATAACRQAMLLSPGDRLAEQNLTLLMQSDQSLPIVEGLLHEFLASNPRDAAAWTLLGQIRLLQARNSEAIETLRRSVALEPHSARHGKLLFSLQCAAGASPEALLAEHREWEAIHAVPLRPQTPPAKRPLAGRPLRIGFLSADFFLHPVCFLVLPLLEHLDKSACFVACYHDRQQDDEFTQRFRAAADLWRPTRHLTDEQLAAQIRADEIDVLVDLGGHTTDRLLVFARRPAALQVTWFGYVGTTGLTTIDCLIADRFHVQPGEERHYVERVLRMPHAYACYEPPEGAPEVTPLPALTAGRVTFGCFNSQLKFPPPLLDAWAEILRRVPGSQLLLQYTGLHQRSIQEHLRSQFANRGIESSQLHIAGWSPILDLLAQYGRVDLALDTQPYSGGLTTCEALWMGVPVITFPGQTFAGRHSLSYLSNVGLQQFVADDIAGYIEMAASWANRLDELAAIRGGLREQVRRSPLCDAATFARDWLQLIREAYVAERSSAPESRSSAAGRRP